MLTPADDQNHIEKTSFRAPFVCGCRNLGEALRRIAEGASMIRTKGEAGTGDIVEAVRHMRELWGGIRMISNMTEEELLEEAPYQSIVNYDETRGLFSYVHGYENQKKRFIYVTF